MVIAPTFARIFYRNAFNVGLPVIAARRRRAGIREGDRLKVDIAAGTVENLTQGKRYDADAFPPFMQS